MPPAGSTRSLDFPSFSEGLSLRVTPGAAGIGIGANFPSFSEGLSLRDDRCTGRGNGRGFPFLFGGTFIEGQFVDGVHRDL